MADGKEKGPVTRLFETVERMCAILEPPYSSPIEAARNIPRRLESDASALVVRAGPYGHELKPEQKELGADIIRRVAMAERIRGMAERDKTLTELAVELSRITIRLQHEAAEALHVSISTANALAAEVAENRAKSI